MGGGAPIPVLVTVDTEEDNWFPARDGITTRSIGGLRRLQEVLSRFGLRATLLTTWQVATSASAMETVLSLRDEAGAEIGAHLHPWNTPPLDEPFGDDTYGWKRLPGGLQERKLATLTRAIEEVTGARPTSFRAGRWSISPAGVVALRRAGYRTDSSVLPFIYWHDVHDGPDFSRAPSSPWWIDGTCDVQTPAREGLVEIPPTVGFSRWPWHPWASVDRVLRTTPLRGFRMLGLLARFEMVDRLALTPEVNDADGMLRLARVAIRHGIPVLNVFLHSGACTPGHTPYVNSAAELERFLGELDRFFERLGGITDFEGLTLGEAGERFRAGRLASAPASPRRA